MSNADLSFLNRSPGAVFNRQQSLTRLLVTGALILGMTTLLSIIRQPSLVIETTNNDTVLHNPGPESLQGLPAENGNLDVAARSSSDDSPISANSTLSITTHLPIVFISPPVIKDLVTQVNVMLPHPLAPATGSFCTWDWCTISPRLYHEPLVDDRTLLGWTDSNGNGHVSVISDTIENTFDFSKSVRGLVAHDDGTFAVLLWDSSSGAMSISKRHADGSKIWTTNIQGPLTVADFWLGGSRLTYGNGQYAAYFTVRGVSGWVEGHFGDQLTYVNDNGVIQAGGWEWGCSHSMAQLVSYHPNLDQFAAICSSDCYASKGILIFDSYVVYNSDGNCGGFTSAQLGQVALSDGGWRLVFNALDTSCCDGQGIALATIDENFQSSYTWLTNTDGTYERDPAIACLGTNISTDRFLVGWTTTEDGVYWLGIIDDAGNFVLGPEEVTSIGVSWGNRDDSFRTRVDGSASWVQGDPESTTLRLFRLDGTAYLP